MKKRNIIRVELSDKLYARVKRETKVSEITLSTLVRIALKKFLK